MVNTDREKLVELLCQATFGVNKQTIESYLPPSAIAEVADHLLASGQVIVLPCKVGDTIYRIASAEHKQRIWEWEIVVVEVYVDGVMFVDDSDNRFDETDIGKTVFLTREEAEAALRKEDEGK